MLHVAHLTPDWAAPGAPLDHGPRDVAPVIRALRTVADIHQEVITIGPDSHIWTQEGVTVRRLRNESPRAAPDEAVSAALWTALEGVDLVHIHQALSVFGAFAVSVARARGIPAVGAGRGGPALGAGHGGPALGAGGHALMLRGRGIALLDGFVCATHDAAERLGAVFSGPHEIFAGPVESSRFPPAPDAPRNRRRVLCAGAILPQSGFDRVIAALPAALSLTIIGAPADAAYHDRLCRMARGKDVRFITTVEAAALARLCWTSGLFVQAGAAAGPVLTPLEAMACGLAVAVADRATLPDPVPDPQFSRAFASDDELGALLDDVARGAWPPPGAAARAAAHAARAHGPEASGRRLAAFYRRILAARAGAGR